MLKAFLSGHPRFLTQHQGKFVGGFTGFFGIGRDQHGLDLVQQVGIVAHVVGVAAGDPPGFVDHHHGIFRHDDGVPHHRNHRRHRGGKAVDIHGFAGRMAVEQVVNGNAVKDVAARGMDVQVDMVEVAQRFHAAGKLAGRHAPVTNLVVNINIGGLVTAGLHAEPAFIARRGFG